jgi:hypothetical protein
MRYRNLRQIADDLNRLGNRVSGLGEYNDANKLWALSRKYRELGTNLRVTLPEGIKKEIE